MECPTYGEIRNQYLGSTTDISNLLSGSSLSVATFLRKAYTLREQTLEKNSEEKHAEIYHVAQKRGLKFKFRKGPKKHVVQNVEKDGLKIKLRTVP